MGAAHVLGYPRLDVNQVCPLGLYGGMARGAATGGGRAACCAVHVGGCSIRPGHGLLVLVQVEQEQFFQQDHHQPSPPGHPEGPRPTLRLAGARPVWYQSLNERSRSLRCLVMSGPKPPSEGGASCGRRNPATRAPGVIDKVMRGVTA